MVKKTLDYILTFISFPLGIWVGIWVSDWQERKRVKKKQYNTLSYVAIYLTHIYTHIREGFNYIFSNVFERENYSFELHEYFDKADFKVFDEKYDIRCLVSFQCLLHDFNHYVKSPKFGNDIKTAQSIEGCFERVWGKFVGTRVSLT